MGRILTIALLLGSALTLGLAPADAVGTGNPVITNPVTQVSDGWLGPVSVDFSNAPASTYNAELYCDNGYWESSSFQYDGSLNTWDWYLPTALNGPTSCTVEVYSGGGASALADFSVLAPPVKLTTVGVHPNPFYPLVRDGYRDSATVVYDLSTPATDVEVRVYNSAGAQVLHTYIGSRSAGRHSWSWNGRNSTGNTVNVGRYKVKLSAIDSENRTSSDTLSVDVTTDIVTRRTTKARLGRDTTSSYAGRSCYVDRNHWHSGDIFLDCWGGTSAGATYRFSMPASAFNIDWVVRGDSYCCTSGHIAKSGVRTSATAFRMGVQVTDWRAYAVNRVEVTYSYRKRI